MFLVTIKEKQHGFVKAKHFKRNFTAIEKFFKAACVAYGIKQEEQTDKQTIYHKEESETHQVEFEALTPRQVVELKKNEPNLFNN